MDNNYLEVTMLGGKWSKSTYSGPNGGNCVEGRVNDDRTVSVRDSKLPDTARFFTVTGSDHNALLRAVGR